MSALVGIAPSIDSGLVQSAHIRRRQHKRLLYQITIVGCLLLIVLMMKPEQMFDDNAVIRFVATYKSQLMVALAVLLLYLSNKMSQVSKGFACGGSMY